MVELSVKIIVIGYYDYEIFIVFNIVNWEKKKKRFIGICESFFVIVFMKGLVEIVFVFDLYFNYFLIEFLGFLYRGDTLNEVFVGLFLVF